MHHSYISTSFLASFFLKSLGHRRWVKTYLLITKIKIFIFNKIIFKLYVCKSVFFELLLWSNFSKVDYYEVIFQSLTILIFAKRSLVKKKYYSLYHAKIELFAGRTQNIIDQTHKGDETTLDRPDPIHKGTKVSEN